MKLVNRDGTHAVDTEDLSPAEYNTRIAMGYATEEQWAAERTADAERVERLEAIDAAEVATVPPADQGYESWTVKQLEAEISTRNGYRDDDAKVSSAGNKPDLIGALEADDKAIADLAAANLPPAPADGAPPAID